MALLLSDPDRAFCVRLVHVNTNPRFRFCLTNLIRLEHFPITLSECLHLSPEGRSEGQRGNVFDSTISKSALSSSNGAAKPSWRRNWTHEEVACPPIGWRVRASSIRSNT